MLLKKDWTHLGEPDEWQAEWKWDGIRGQIIKRNNELFVWSRGEELMTDKFPEYHALQRCLPDGVVLDGEIIPESRDGKATCLLRCCKHVSAEKISLRNNCRKRPFHFLPTTCWNMKGEDWRERDH